MLRWLKADIWIPNRIWSNANTHLHYIHKDCFVVKSAETTGSTAVKQAGTLSLGTMKESIISCGLSQSWTCDYYVSYYSCTFMFSTLSFWCKPLRCGRVKFGSNVTLASCCVAQGANYYYMVTDAGFHRDRLTLQQHKSGERSAILRLISVKL